MTLVCTNDDAFTLAQLSLEMLSLDEIATRIGMTKEGVRKKISYWINNQILAEVKKDYFQLVETSDGIILSLKAPRKLTTFVKTPRIPHPKPPMVEKRKKRDKWRLPQRSSPKRCE